MARQPKKRIQWNAGHKSGPRPQQNQYYSDVELPVEKKELYEKHLTPGALFVTVTPVAPSNSIASTSYRYLIQAWYTSETKNPGTLAIYLGQVRVEESVGRTTRRVLRHSFIVDGCRYVVIDLNLLKPLDDESLLKV